MLCALDKVVATALGHLATAWTAVLVAHHDQQIDVYNFVYSVLKKIAPFLSKLVSTRALTGNAHPNLRGEGGQFPPVALKQRFASMEFSVKFRGEKTRKQYRCQENVGPRTAGRRFCAVQAFWACGPKPWRRGNSFAPSILIAHSIHKK